MKILLPLIAAVLILGAIAIFGGMALNNHNDSKMMITKFLIKVRKIQTRKIMTKIKQLVTKIKTKIKINHLQITIHQAQIVMHLDQMKMVITQIAITKTAQLITKTKVLKTKTINKTMVMQHKGIMANKINKVNNHTL